MKTSSGHKRMRYFVATLRTIWRSLVGGHEQDTGERSAATNKTDNTVTTTGGVSVTIRRYKKRDRRDVLRIARTTFDGVCLDENIEKDFGQVGDKWRTLKKNAVDYDLKNNPSSTFVAISGGHIIGFICTRLYQPRNLGHVANMAIEKSHQGQGIGQAMLEHALDYFEAQGMKFARIETLEQNEKARDFYPSMGFKEVGRQVFYFKEL